MKKLIYFIISLASASMALMGCGNNGGGGGAPAAVSTTCTWQQTPSGTACIGANGGFITSNTGIVGVTQYYDYKFYFDLTTGGYNPYQQGSLTIVNTGAYKQFLKEALQVCDLSTISWGGANCDTWIQGSLAVQFSIDGTMRPHVIFSAVPIQSIFTVNLGLFKSGMPQNPLQLVNNTTFSLINNSKGFEIRSNGSAFNGGGLRLIQIQVETGILSDGSFNYKLIYPLNNAPTTFAVGTFKRY